MIGDSFQKMITSRFNRLIFNLSNSSLHAKKNLYSV